MADEANAKEPQHRERSCVLRWSALPEPRRRRRGWERGCALRRGALPEPRRRWRDGLRHSYSICCSMQKKS